MKHLADWRVLALTTVIFWGFQGIIVKSAVSRVSWRATCMCVMLGFFLVALLAFLARPGPRFGSGHVIAFFGGMVGGVGSLAFYKALEGVDVSLIVPITAQYVLVSAILGFLVLGEPVTLNKVAGAILGVAAVILLSLKQPEPPTARPDHSAEMQTRNPTNLSQQVGNSLRRQEARQ